MRPDDANEMESPTDMEIVRSVAAGDTEAFGLLVERHSARLYNLAFGMLHDAQCAEDVVQEAFVRAYEHLDGFRGACSFATWLYRIAYNRALRECGRRRFGRIEDPACRALPEEPDARYDEETVARMRQALERLKADERALVTLFYDEERSVAEIAAITELSESNVKVKLHRIRRRIRELMEEE